MSVDGEPINNPEVIRRAEVDRVKGLIKQDNLIFREHNVDSPGPNDLDGKERDLIRSFGLAKVETVQQLFDSLNDPNRGHEAPKEKLDILATAICESMIEAGRSDIVVAGSYSIEKQLQLSGFNARDDKNEDAPSFAFMVAQKFRERFSAGEARDSVTNIMEYLDYIKNSDYRKNGGLEEAADQAYKDLLKIKLNILNKKEIEARAAVLQYVFELKGGDRIVTEVNNRTREEQVSTEKKASSPAENSRGNRENKRKNPYPDLDTIETETDVDVLTELARKNLDYIESLEDYSNKYRLTGQPTDVLDKISIRLSYLISESKKNNKVDDKEKYDLLRVEIISRLAIFDIGKAMRESNFRIAEKGKGFGVGDAIEQCAKSNRVMTPEVLRFCFKEAKRVGYDIPGAWNMIQDANFDYESILKKVWESGMAKSLFSGDDKTTEEAKRVKFLSINQKMSCVKGQKGGLFMDSSFWPDRASLVEEYIISQLGNNGEKAYRLAQELVDATGERSSFNFGFINGDSTCEAIYFEDFRNDDASKGKNVGPMSNRGIYSLARGWLRDFSDTDHGYDLNKKNGKIYAEQIQSEKAIGKKTATMYFGKILSSYVLTTRAALMDSDPDFKRILNPSWVKELVGSFDKVDVPYDVVKGLDGQYRKATEEDDMGVKEKSRSGEQDIKTLYVLGLMELILTKSSIEWDFNLTREFKNIFVDTILSDSNKSFINEEQWKWCLEQKIAHINRKGKNISLNFNEGVKLKQREAFKRSFFDDVTHPKKKR